MLDAIGYGIAWVTAPLVSLDNPRIVDVLDGVGYEPEAFLDTVLGGVNILAVEKSRFDELIATKRWERLLIPVNVRGSPYILSYGLQRCIPATHPIFAAYEKATGKTLNPEQMCRQMTQVHPTEATGALNCGEYLYISQEDYDYWEQWV